MTHSAPESEPAPSPAPVSPVRHPWYRRPLPLISAAVVIIVIAGAAGYFAVSSQKSKTFTTHGEVDVRGDATTVRVGAGTCSGIGGYDDLNVGAEVVISDSTGKTLAVGAITGASGPNLSECDLVFNIDVPSGKKFYGVSVTHRGIAQETEAQMKAGVQLTIGSAN